MLIEVYKDRDTTGDWEEFTWDLFPVVAAEHTLHLGADGLPKLGTEIKPGMIIVGKIGKSSTYDAECQPTSLEANALRFEELHSRYAHQWRDASFYANSETIGAVTEAYLSGHGETQRAVVVLTGRTGERADAYSQDAALAHEHHS